jgi:uncharacterized membrane protein YagU involved in acid resistance
MNPLTRNKLIWNAVPSIFAVPNAPKLLESRRRPPLKRDIPNQLPHSEKKVKLSGTKMIISFVLMHVALVVLLSIKYCVLKDSFVDKFIRKIL